MAGLVLASVGVGVVVTALTSHGIFGLVAMAVTMIVWAVADGTVLDEPLP